MILFQNNYNLKTKGSFATDSNSQGIYSRSDIPLKNMKIPFTNSVIATIHNTPLNSSKNRNYKYVQQVSSTASKNRNIIDGIKCISSMQNASHTVSKEMKVKGTKENTQPKRTIKYKPINDYNIWASKVPDMGLNVTPNKPFRTPRKASAFNRGNSAQMRTSQYNSQFKRQSFQPTLEKQPVVVIKSHKKQEKSERGVSYEKDKYRQIADPSKSSTHASTHKESPKVGEGDKETSSWTSNIFTKIQNWIHKDLTNFWWKCSEQDKTLNWCARAGKWVRDAETFRGGEPSQQNYLEEYNNLKSIIDRNYSASPNDSLDTITGNKFEMQLAQIEKDIDRTMNNHPYFGDGKEGQDHLRCVLKILALKYTDIGYVQGMNFLVVSILYHCSPEITLFLITVLIEDYELWDIYRENVQGLHLRNGIIKDQIQEKLPELGEQFTEIGIDPQMFTTEWVLDLFSHIIPLNLYGQFLDNFITDGKPNRNTNSGWKFFYQMIVSILSILQRDLLGNWEWDEMLLYIKNYVNNSKSGINWGKVMNMAKNA